MKSFAYIVALASAVAAAASASAAPAPGRNAPAASIASLANPAQAERLFKRTCASCHMSGAGGAPTVAALRTRTSAAIRTALETGVMAVQGSQLTRAERSSLADYLGKPAQGIAKAGPRSLRCTGRLTLAGAPLWNRWGNGLDNRRYQSAAIGGITPATVGKLELKWAFGFPDAARARSQPAVTSEAIFTGSQSGRVYALDAATGCIWWTFDAAAEVRSAPTLGTDARGRIDALYFGDFNANVYAVNPRTGALLWKKSVQDHPQGMQTGSLTLYDGRLFVPMSSSEVVSAIDHKYACCTFRGGITALDARNGRTLWRMYTTEPPVETGKNAVGSPSIGPSGAPVWSTPTVDRKRGLLYFGTGENYSSPANGMSDSIIAVDLATGAIRWVRQTVAGDAWNAACLRAGSLANCPKEDGPDFDFGAPPILAKLENGKDILLAGQKSGMIYGLDPDADGKILWQVRAGMGGFNGGVHWGMATAGPTLFVGIADTPGNKGAVGPRRNGLHAFRSETGEPLWSILEKPTCTVVGFQCDTALSAPVTLTDGIVFAGAHNGLLRAYSTQDGRLLWSTDTRRKFATVNGVAAVGGSIDSAGPVVAGGRLIVNSGYDKFGEIPGNVLLVFGPKIAKDRK